MRHADETLGRFGVARESRVVSAHRTPDWLREFASAAEGRGVRSSSPARAGRHTCPAWRGPAILPVLGVAGAEPRAQRDGLAAVDRADAGRRAVGTMSIGRAGATNAALLAVAMLATTRPELRERLRAIPRRADPQGARRRLP
jgi:5-(carboxyamino)imidazole ribonucleotide mutase